MWNRALILIWLMISVLGVGGMVTACGHKGELYLPGADEQEDRERAS